MLASLACFLAVASATVKMASTCKWWFNNCAKISFLASMFFRSLLCYFPSKLWTTVQKAGVSLLQTSIDFPFGRSVFSSLLFSILLCIPSILFFQILCLEIWCDWQSSSNASSKSGSSNYSNGKLFAKDGLL